MNKSEEIKIIRKPKGLSPVQEHYKQLVEKNCIFHVKGQSLLCRGHKFPIAMAKAINIRPKKVDFHDLAYAWDKY